MNADVFPAVVSLPRKRETTAGNTSAFAGYCLFNLVSRRFPIIARFQKIVKDLNRQLQSQGSGPWMPNVVASLERSLGELSRILESKVSKNRTFQCGPGKCET